MRKPRARTAWQLNLVLGVMASSSQTLRLQLELLARDTHQRLDEARALHVRFGEETITDLLLLEIKRQKRIGSRLD